MGGGGHYSVGNRVRTV